MQFLPVCTDSWMIMPTEVPNCPPGLEYLTLIDQLLVHQKVELLEAFTGFQTNNKYAIRNTLGQNVREDVCLTLFITPIVVRKSIVFIRFISFYNRKCSISVHKIGHFFIQIYSF